MHDNPKGVTVVLEITNCCCCGLAISNKKNKAREIWFMAAKVDEIYITDGWLIVKKKGVKRYFNYKN